MVSGDSRSLVFVSATACVRVLACVKVLACVRVLASVRVLACVDMAVQLGTAQVHA